MLIMMMLTKHRSSCTFCKLTERKNGKMNLDELNMFRVYVKMLLKPVDLYNTNTWHTLHV